MALMVVLLIEDTEDTTDMYAYALNREKIATLTAPDGEEGLRLAIEAQPDAIVLDLGLPRMDGWEVARRLKQDPSTRRIPVIVLSAHAYAADRARASAEGVESFLAKPCLPDDLIAEIRRNVLR